MTAKNLAFRMQTFIGGTPEQVWRALTTPDLSAVWWDRIVEADYRPGGRILYEVKEGITIDGEILEVEAPRRLVFTFHCNAFPDHPRSRVSWDIEPVEGGCLLNLVHDGFPRADLGLSEVSRHWPSILGDLRRCVEEDPRFAAAPAGGA